MVEIYKKDIVYDRPVYVGTGVLDLSKLCMMDFHYNTIENNFNDRYNLIYSDTDSLVYNIQHDDIYQWIKDNKQHFDLSDSIRSDLIDNTNKNVLVKFKDATNTFLITEFLALNPKVYSMNYLTIDEFQKTVMKNCKKLKGVSKAVVKNEISHNDYVNVHQTKKPINKEVVFIRSFNHKLYTFKQT